MIQKDVRDVLADQILFGALENGGTVTIGVTDNRLTFTYESRSGPESPAAPASAQ